MKKFMNESDLMLRESLSGLVEAHPQVLRVEFEPTFVARRERASNKVALVSGGGSGHEPLHAGFVGRRHARCRLPRAGLHLAHARPDAGCRGGGRSRPGRALHREELCRRPDELRDGQRDARDRERHRAGQRRRGGRELHPHHRTARRGGHAGGGEDGRRGGRAGREPRRVQGAGRARERRDCLDGRGLHQLHGAGGRPPHLRHRARRDRGRRRHPRRARTPARDPPAGRRDRAHC